ncbi:WhiB family transcriptional regulator [Rhodococcus sp. NPDC057529]|uniref:WhiB family transcriptional regulator n=1 Tax=Rhodococcus sp. NPDC057529 TaxID=3346158 RepID=UPI00366B8C19
MPDRVNATATLADGWHLRARCRITVEHLFFAPEVERQGARMRREKAAKRICVDCPVLRECLTYALHAGVSHGIWGGMSEKDRRSLTSASADHLCRSNATVDCRPGADARR